ncbi:hypothetical protein [Burkholderia ambifaria]|uniref:hypothetical protein n=1 Tax=Burkholderia ambifaria TaxID=152480 RepID=UPI0002E430BE|nr:hypothetical protein [Burkholderia ambifaria]
MERRNDRAIVIVRLGDAGVAVLLDATTLAHDASLLEVASGLGAALCPATSRRGARIPC